MRRAIRMYAGLGLVVALMVGHAARGARPGAPVPLPNGSPATTRVHASSDRTTWADLPAATQHGILDAMRQARRVEGTDTLAFSNPRQRLQAAIAPGRVRVAGAAGAQVQFLTPALGRPGTLTPMTAATAVATDTARVELPRTAGAVAVTEWWTNDATGLEQGFVVHARPAGDGPLLVRQPYDTTLAAALQDEARTVVFADASGERLRYAGLKAWDATGRALDAHVALETSALVLTTDDTDAVYPVTIDPTWYQQAYLKASNPEAGDVFSWSVAISGDTVVVGAKNECSTARGVNGDQTNNDLCQAGAAYVFVRTGPTWTQQAYLKASNTDNLQTVYGPNGSGELDQFGWSVAISGDTVVVGAPREDSAATGVNGNETDNSLPDTGAAYVFQRSSLTGQWSQQAYLKPSTTGSGGGWFGYAVAISGDTVVVGAGAQERAYVFVRAGGTWTPQGDLRPEVLNGGIFFGGAVAISGDTIVVGAQQESSAATGVNGNAADTSAYHAGAAYVFVRSGATWTQQAYLKASNTDPGDNFGASVAASGDTVVVGAPHEDSAARGVNGDQGNFNGWLGFDAGAAYVFVRSGTTWTQQAYLKASNSGIYNIFGYGLAISGDTVVVGGGDSSAATGVNGDQWDTSAPGAGAAYVFVRSGTTWSQEAYLKASNTEAGDSFGRTVAISAPAFEPGDYTVVVGAVDEDSAAPGVDGNQADNSARAAGAVYVFQRFDVALAPATWTLSEYGGQQRVTVTITDSAGRTVNDPAQWTATSNQPWLEVSPSRGIGSEAVTLTAYEHTTSAQPRTATVTIGPKTVTVTQAGATPRFTVTPTIWYPASYGDFLTVTITSTPPDGTWTATSSQPWLTLSRAGGTGSGTVMLTAAPNPSSLTERTATVTIGGETVWVTQLAGPAWFTVTPTTWPAPAAGGTQTVTVTASHTDAAWTASSNQPWLIVTPAGRTGSGTVTLTAAANPSSVNNRVATATIAGHLVNVTQAAGTASFTVSPTTWNFAAAGGAQPVTLTASHTDAAWTASSDQSWLTVSPASGHGGATVTLTAATNGNLSARTATATIGGQTVVVTQAIGTAWFLVTPAYWGVQGEGGVTSVTLTATPEGAPWTASSDQPWLTVTPSSGTGSGSLTLTAAPNPGTSTRTATATIAGQAVVVQQNGGIAAPPPAPGALRASVVGRTVTFDWLQPVSVAPITGYLLQAGLAPGRTDIAPIALGPDSTRYVVDGVPDGRYFVRVLASNRVGISGPSNEVEVGVGNAGTPPQPPTGLAPTVTGTTVQLTWRAASTGGAPTGYTLEAGAAPGLSNIATLSLGPSTSFSTGGVPIGLYYVRVRASNSFGVSGPSNEVAFSVGGVSAPPGPPSSLTASVTGSTVTLTWQAPASGGPPTTYVLEAGSGPGQANILPGMATGNTLTTFVAGAVPVGTYYVRVRALNLAGLSAASNEVTVAVTSADRPETPTLAAPVPTAETAPLGSPTSLQGVVAARMVTLSWQAPMAGAPFAHYVVEARRADDGAAWAVAALATAPAMVLAGVAPGAYYVRVRTTDGRGLSPTSNELLVLVR